MIPPGREFLIGHAARALARADYYKSVSWYFADMKRREAMKSEYLCTKVLINIEILNSKS